MGFVHRSNDVTLNRHRAIAALLIIVALARMAVTFRVFSQTADEGMHVGAGLELLQQHTYTMQRENPPLSPVIMAIAPWLGGMRIDMQASGFAMLNSVLYGHGKYERNLFLMRVGNLLFFALASCVLWIWVRREIGDAEALVALLLFTTQPIVIGYSALATLDAAAVAGVAVALLAFSSWLRNPTIARAAIVGAAFGFSILCKFSSIAFVPVACAAMFVVRRHTRGLVTLCVVPFVAAFVIWTGYAFTVDAFVSGVVGLWRINRAGHLCYFLGERSMRGWIAYFPVAIALKTTLPFLALLAAGVAMSTRAVAEPIAAAAAIIAVAMTSTLDLGVRYVLPAYVPLTFAAAIAAVSLARSSRNGKWAAIVLIALHCAISFAAHPDYFPYFNAVAGRDPSRYLIDSNLDWGQDILRLRRAVRQRHIESLGVSLAGIADLQALGFPPTHYVGEFAAEPRGWVAVSDHSYRMSQTIGGWSWIDRRPYVRIGKSIRLYNLPHAENESRQAETRR